MSEYDRTKLVTVVLGSQWGDEGKGKIVDTLASSADLVCRCQGGSNADHAVLVNGSKFIFHLIPSGLINPSCIAVIGNGVVVHLPSLFRELDEINAQGLKDWKNRLVISDRAHLVFDFHQRVDQLQELDKGTKFLGTTKTGIGPAYSSKIARTGIRVDDLVSDWNCFTEKFLYLVVSHKKAYPELEVDVKAELVRYKDFAARLKPFVKETVHYIHRALKQGKKIVVEGANAALLDINLGTYPYVTSSSPSIGGVCTGLGLPANSIGEVVGVVKAYTTRVGEGPFPTELLDTTGKMLQLRGAEIAMTTGRSRRCGWLDLVLLRYTAMINGYTSICLTKLDILDTLKIVKVCVSYLLDGKEIDYFPSSAHDLAKVEPVYEEVDGWMTSTESVRSFNDLPLKAQSYVLMLEKFLGVSVKWIGVGADRESIIWV